MPRPVEGRLASQEEIAEKAANGRLYVDDISKIVREFDTAAEFDTHGADLDTLETRLAERLAGAGFKVLDVSHEFDGVKHALQLATAWSEVAHRARNEKTLFLVRRTPTNTPALLMQQRLEHVRGRCSEFSPIALAVLARDVQLLFNRGCIPAAAQLDEQIAAWVSERETVLDDATRVTAAAAAAPPSAIPEEAEAPPPAPPSMGTAAFQRQRASMARLYRELDVERLDPDAADRIKETALRIGELSL